MYFTLSSSPSAPTTSFSHLLSSSHRNPIFNFSSFAPKHHRRGRPQIRRFSIKSSHKPPSLFLPPPIFAGATVKLTETLSISSLSIEKQPKPASSCDDEENNVLKCIAKPIAFTLFYIVIGLFPFFRGFELPAIAAAPAASEVLKRTKKSKENEVVLKQKDHEYSGFTRRLLGTVSGLLRRVEEARSGKGNLKAVEAALWEVKLKKRQLQEEIMTGLYVELRELKAEKGELVKKSEEILDSVLKAKREEDNLLRRAVGENDGEKVKEQMAKLEEEMGSGEKEYNGLWEKVGEIEDRILRRETMALSIGVRELCFIERESEHLVEKFRREMRQQGNESVMKKPLTKLSKSDVQKELQSATRQLWQQMILPSVLEAEDIGHSFDQDSIEFAQRIKQALKYSQDLQKNLEVGISKNMKMFGDEKRFVVNTPVDEVVKGFPEVELKWMFGRKEIVVPKAAGLHLLHGWKKWREEAKSELKRNLLENVEFGKKYVAEKQERLLLDRDRLASKTWYNEERNRWEMDTMAVPYAVSRKLVENARIRHDWAAMYLAMKGDDKEYFVDLKEFETLFEDFGGFDGLYLRMLASGIPTAVQLMWIPFSELDFRQQFLLIMRISQQCFYGLWNTKIVSYARKWVLEKIRNMNDDIMMMIVFPLVELIVPFPVIPL
ncbi:hypothetical protein U1Q18_002668 [Sarracenia purpurea var. burkii]